MKRTAQTITHTTKCQDCGTVLPCECQHPEANHHGARCTPCWIEFNRKINENADYSDMMANYD